MEGCLLRVYLHESQRCHRRLAWEWLLDQANQMGIRGGSAFKAMGGFGHHHHLQEAKFYELAGDLGVMVEFVVTEQEFQALVALLRQEKIRAFHARIPAQFGVVNPDVDEARAPGETGPA